MEGQRVAAFRRPRPCGDFAGESDLFATESRLIANHRACAALAGQAAAHGYARWVSLDREVKLSAATRRVSGGHE